MRKLRNVVSPFPQRWHAHGDDLQPVVEVASELPLRNQLLKILVGGRHDADARRNGLIAAHAFKLLVLKQAQHLGLHGQGHVADFVEQDRPIVALLELADSLTIRARERTLFVAEQFAFDQVLRQCRAVDRQERFVGLAALL